MFVMGTSLTVQPFASLPGFAMDGVPRVLLNLARVGSMGTRPDDVLILEDCDSGVRKLADALGWREELESLFKEVGPTEVPKTKTEEVPKTKDEALEDEITKLTEEVDHTLKLSNDHKEYLEKNLAEKSSTDNGRDRLPDIGNEPLTDPLTGVGETAESVADSKPTETETSTVLPATDSRGEKEDFVQTPSLTEPTPSEPPSTATATVPTSSSINDQEKILESHI